MTRTEEVVKCHKTLCREKHFPYTGEQKQPDRIRACLNVSTVDACSRVSTRFLPALDGRPSPFPLLQTPECRGTVTTSRKSPSVAFSRREKPTDRNRGGNARSSELHWRWKSCVTHIYRHSRSVDQSLPNTGPAVLWDLVNPQLDISPVAFSSSFSFSRTRRELGKLVLGLERLARTTHSTVCRRSEGS